MFLTEAHQCDESWEKVLAQTHLLNSDSFEKYSISLLAKSNHGFANTPVEMDTLAHKLQDVEDLASLEIFEPLLRGVRVGPRAGGFHWGTSHAIVRGYLDMNLSMRLTDRLLPHKREFGIFLDGYSAAFLLNDLILKKDWIRCSRIAEDLMLQETFFTPLLRRMSMFGLLKHFEDGGVDKRQEAWEEEEENRRALDALEEDKMEYYYYLPNGYNDDHFDLERPVDIVGKTAMMMGVEEGGDLGASFLLLGSALRGKEALVKTLGDLNAFDRKVSKAIADAVSARFEDEDDVGELFGELKISEEVSDCVAELTASIEADVKFGVEEFRGSYEALMAGWTAERREVTEKEHWENQEKEMRRLAMEQIKQLEKQEEVLTFFENELKVELLADLAVKTEQETKRVEESAHSKNRRLFERYVRSLHPDLVDHKKILGKTWMPVQCRRARAGNAGADELYYWQDYYKRPWWSF